MGKKQDVIVALYDLCRSRGDFTFTNDDDVRPMCIAYGFTNTFDVTKLDQSRLLPEELVNDDVYIIHLGKGRHQFVSGIAKGYHQFEPVPTVDQWDWKYHPSLLNNANTSESNSLSMAYNQRIIHDFLYRDIAASPKMYISNRTFIRVKYHVGNAEVDFQRLQVEIDATFEHNGEVTFFEAKNGDPTDFNVFQLFHPYLYFLGLAEQREIKEIRCCYLVRSRDRARILLYLYTFDDPDDPGSVRLERNAEYTLVQR